MVYKLEVYRTGRKSEQVFVERVFTSENTQAELYNKFVHDYKGFNIRVINVGNISVEAVVKQDNKPQTNIPNGKPKETSTIIINHPLSDEDRDAYSKISLSKKTTEILRKKLSSDIKERYNNITPKLGCVSKVNLNDDESYKNIEVTIQLYHGVETITEYLSSNEKNTTKDA